MAASPRPLRKVQGFTLMEITLSIVLLGLLAVVGAQMMASSFFTTRVIGNEHQSNSMARYAMERLARDIREIEFDTATNNVGITLMTASQMSFVKSGLSGPTNMGISYTNPNLVLTSDTQTQTLATPISAFSLTYLDGNKAVTSTPNAVRHVRITLTTAPDQAQAITLLTQVKLRNP